MSQWQLIDGREPVEDPDAFPKLLASSELDLRHKLEQFRQQDPGMFSLTSPDGGDALQIGLGGPFGGVRWFENAKDSLRSRVLLADRLYSKHHVDFLAEGDTNTFWPEQLMPADQLIEVIVHYYNHHRLPDWVAWKEWDPVKDGWTYKPATAVRSA
jgi:hypothetical protein